MKTSELRIGNIVFAKNTRENYFERKTSFNKNVIVENIFSESINFKDLNCDDWEDIHADDIEPIPFTKELFKKMGAVETFEGIDSLKLEIPGKADLVFDFHYKWIIEGECAGETDYTYIEIDYVHTLQNAYFLLRKEELDYKIFKLID